MATTQRYLEADEKDVTSAILAVGKMAGATTGVPVCPVAVSVG